MDEKAVVTWNMTVSVDFDALKIAGLEARSAATQGTLDSELATQRAELTVVTL